MKTTSEQVALSHRLIREAHAVIYAAYELIDDEMSHDQVFSAMSKGIAKMEATTHELRTQPLKGTNNG